MKSVRNLIELLKSQFALYTEIKDILVAEKQAIINWKFTDTPRLVKEKEALFNKERILEEARKTLAARVANEYGISDITLSAIIDACPDEECKQEFSSLREKLSRIAIEISNENTALKILYSTNIRLINDLYAKIGYSPINKYGLEKGRNNKASMPSALSALG